MLFFVLEKLPLWFNGKFGWKLCHASIHAALGNIQRPLFDLLLMTFGFSLDVSELESLVGTDHHILECRDF
jgi:hypothetical protein